MEKLSIGVKLTEQESKGAAKAIATAQKQMQAALKKAGVSGAQFSSWIFELTLILKKLGRDAEYQEIVKLTNEAQKYIENMKKKVAKIILKVK